MNTWRVITKTGDGTVEAFSLSEALEAAKLHYEDVEQVTLIDPAPEQIGPLQQAFAILNRSGFITDEQLAILQEAP